MLPCSELQIISFAHSIRANSKKNSLFSFSIFESSKNVHFFRTNF